MRWALPPAAVLLLSLVLAACGSSPRSLSSGPGQASSPASAPGQTRVVDITASDDMSFTPATVTVRRGETVTFKITNTGAIDHEFVLGDEETQMGHENEMATSPGMSMSDQSGEATIPPNESRTVTYTFDRTGELLYGCHEPGHYAAGMKGVITIQAAG